MTYFNVPVSIDRSVLIIFGCLQLIQIIVTIKIAIEYTRIVRLYGKSIDV